MFDLYKIAKCEWISDISREGNRITWVLIEDYYQCASHINGVTIIPSIECSASALIAGDSIKMIHFIHTHDSNIREKKKFEIHATYFRAGCTKFMRRAFHAARLSSSNHMRISIAFWMEMDLNVFKLQLSRVVKHKTNRTKNPACTHNVHYKTGYSDSVITHIRTFK